MPLQMRLFLAGLLAGASLAQAEVLVNTKLHPFEVITRGGSLQLDLREHFQRYSDPGPVATFTLYMPEQAGWMEINFADGGLSAVKAETLENRKYMTYKLAAGGTYNNAYSAYPEQFVWREATVQYQLLADQAPVTVANFMTYAGQGDFANTIVHRSEINVLQAGGLRISDSEDYLLQWIETLPAIVFEQTKNNTAGTLSMARQSALNTATSQFFINLEDNSNAFGSAYTVFGELVDLQTKLPLLQEMGDANVYNLTSYLSTAPVSSIPLYTPYWDDKGSYVRFKAISVPAGNADGVTYAQAFATNLPDTATDEQKADEAANQAVFDVTLNGSILTISRHDTGQATVEVTGTYNGVSRSFKINLTGYNPDALESFPNSRIEQEGWIENNWYGWLVAEDYPFVQHLNHGNQYILRVRNEATYALSYFIYDYQLGSWLYTTATLYPHLYNFQLGAWTWYQKDSGNGFDPNVQRWFYNYGISDWFTN